MRKFDLSGIIIGIGIVLFAARLSVALGLLLGVAARKKENTNG